MSLTLWHSALHHHISQFIYFLTFSFLSVSYDVSFFSSLDSLTHNYFLLIQFTTHYFTLLYFTLLYFILFFLFTLFYLPLLNVDHLLHFHRIYNPSLKFTLLDFTLLYCTSVKLTSISFSELSFAQLHINLLCFHLLYLTSCHFFWFCWTSFFSLNLTLLSHHAALHSLMLQCISWVKLQCSHQSCYLRHHSVMYYTWHIILYDRMQLYAMLDNTVFCCTILYYTILYYTILYYTILYYTILYYTTLHCIILYYTTLHCIRLYLTILHNTTSQRNTPQHNNILHWKLLHCTTLKCTAYTLLPIVSGSINNLKGSV